MNIRRILYIAVFCAIAAFFYYNQQPSDITTVPQAIKQQSVLQTFKAQTAQLPEDLTKAAYHPDGIYFPGDYQGQAGNEFYVSLAQGEKYLTLKYMIRATDSADRLEYYCKDRWENYRPPAGKFEQYQLQDGAWEKVD
jgi:hypothetical protein